MTSDPHTVFLASPARLKSWILTLFRTLAPLAPSAILYVVERAQKSSAARADMPVPFPVFLLGGTKTGLQTIFEVSTDPRKSVIEPY